MRHAHLVVLVVLPPVLLCIAPVRHAIESSMFLHMLLQFPLLFASGAAGARVLAGSSTCLTRAWSVVDHECILSAVVLSGVAALWMVPAALDAALIQPEAAALKYMSWWFAGFSVSMSWRRTSGVLRLFLLGNLAWMFATAGLLFLESELRLCVSYRLDEQAATGAALLALSGLMVAYLGASSLPGVGLAGHCCKSKSRRPGEGQ